MLVKLKPAIIDEPSIRAVLGDRCCRTLPEVAREFGVAHNTVRQSWRPEGMPGEPGRWRLADIVLWRLRYERSLDEKRQSFTKIEGSDVERRKAEAELRKVELDVERKEREELDAAGKLIDRKAAATGFKTAAAVLAERLMKLPSKWEPGLPVEIALEQTEMARRDIRRELVGFSETLARDVLKEGQSIVDL